MNFVKMQATGNDFILIDARGLKYDWSKLARAMCHRHFGVGADGLLLLLPSAAADFWMRTINSDGSEAEVCGNGLRCFAKYVVDNGLTPSGELRVETIAGIRAIRAEVKDGKVERVQANMGRPRLAPAEIPALVAASQGALNITSIIAYPITVGARELRISCVSMGNPHAVCFLDEPVADFPLAELGPKVENHPMFPNRVNFEVANILSQWQVRARVWERGVGETLCCASGACAIAVAARLLGYAETPIEATFKGGTVVIGWDGAGEVLLSGPAETVFKGEWVG